MSGDSGAPDTDPASGGAATNDRAGAGSPPSLGLLDVDDVIGIGGAWMDSLAAVLEDLASTGRSIAVDHVPCVGGRCEVFSGGIGPGTIIALAAILAGLAVIATASVRRSGWLLRR